MLYSIRHLKCDYSFQKHNLHLQWVLFWNVYGKESNLLVFFSDSYEYGNVISILQSIISSPKSLTEL